MKNRPGRENAVFIGGPIPLIEYIYAAAIHAREQGMRPVLMENPKRRVNAANDEGAIKRARERDRDEG